jgi:ribonuclease HI
VKVKGHCGNMENELADALATGDKIKYQKLLKKYSLEGDYVL